MKIVTNILKTYGDNTTALTTPTFAAFSRNTRLMKKIALLSTLVLGTALVPLAKAAPPLLSPAIAPGSVNTLNFHMIPSPGLPVGLQNAGANIIVHTEGPVEVMEVFVAGLPPNTDFDFFVIQKPNAPFGLSWYQGDIETDANGQGFALFTGRFNVESFIVSPGTVPAPVVFSNTFSDGNIGATVGRVHTYHCGLWFNSPADAANAGAGGAVTPFNGEGNAGRQVLNTANFPDLAGPLINVR
jgi:hypothetical protein